MNNIKNDFRDTENGLEYCGKVISPFYPVLLKRYIEIDSDTKKRTEKYEITVRLCDGSELATHIFKTLNIPSYFEHWKECQDALLSPKDRQILHAYLQGQVEGVPVEEILNFSKMGLTESGYVYGMNQVIMLSGSLRFYSLRTIHIPEFSQADINREMMISHISNLFSAKKGVSDILLLASILPTLKPLFYQAGIPVNFYLVLFGTSGMGKSTWARMLFTQIPEQELSFKTTNQREIKEKLELFSGHSVLIDDYHPEEERYKEQRQNSLLDFIARKAEEANAAFPVVTAEYLGGCFSVQDRMLQVEIADKVVNGNCVREMAFYRECMSFFLLDFAREIYTKKDEVNEMIRKIVEIDTRKSGYRICSTINILWKCFKVLYDFYLTPDEQCKLQKNIGDVQGYIRNNLENICKYQERRMELVKEVENGIDWIEVLYRIIYVEKMLYICPNMEYVERKEFDKRGIILWNDRFYIPKMALERALRKYFCRLVKSKKIINALIEENILDEDCSASHMKKYKKKYCYVVNKYRLEEYHEAIHDEVK